MRKILLLAIIAMFFACNSSVKKSNDSTTMETDIKSVYIDGIKFELFDTSENFARIVCDSMILDTLILNKVLDSLKIEVDPVYFHIKELKETGEEFATSFNGKSSIYDFPPRNKHDVAINTLALKLISDKLNVDFLSKSKDLNFDEISSYLSTFEAAVNTLKECEAEKDNKRISDLSNKLKTSTVNCQVKIFPKLRNIFAEEMKQRLWREDIDVIYTNKNITLIGGIYAANKNIEDSYTAISDRLYELRFKRIAFKWYEYDNGVYYTVSSLPDNFIY